MGLHFGPVQRSKSISHTYMLCFLYLCLATHTQGIDGDKLRYQDDNNVLHLEGKFSTEGLKDVE